MILPQGLQTVLHSLLISAVVSAVAIGSYERWIRQPRTPRLAVVDVGQLFAQVQQAGSLATIRDSGARVNETKNSDFGPRLQSALEATARRCACTLVAMPAVFGVSAGVPDLTAAVRERLVSTSNAPGVPPVAGPSAP
jgi:hypothetical protein